MSKRLDPMSLLPRRSLSTWVSATSQTPDGSATDLTGFTPALRTTQATPSMSWTPRGKVRSLKYLADWTRPNLTGSLAGDSQLFIAYALFSMVWIGFLYLLTPPYLEDTVMTACFALLAGGLYGCHDMPDLRHHGHHHPTPFTPPFLPQKVGDGPGYLNSYIQYPRHYWLYCRVLWWQNQLVTWWDMDPWDSDKCKSHQQHKWIHIPGESYGPLFDSFCGCFDPLLLLLLMRNNLNFGSSN
jgi:hypothetical protein